MNNKLFDGSDGDNSDNELELATNKDYAKSYNNFRKKELLKKFKDRGYDVSESDSDTSSESESTEDEDVANPEFDQEFFKTLASLKSKNPAIYDSNTRFFENLNNEVKQEEDANNIGESSKATSSTVNIKQKQKPVTLRDYERGIILEKNGKFEDDSDVEIEGNPFREPSPTLVEEERHLKAEFKNALHADDSEDEEEFGGIFKKRTRTKAEQEKDEEDYVKWLAGKQQDIEEDAKEKLLPLKDYWSSSKLPQSEKFLRDYILNKGYASAKESEIPTYEEIVTDCAPLSEDELELEKQDEFEEKYNFRFEEPDAEFIKRYPRTIENSVRRTDEKRKEKRQQNAQRKLEEKQKKMKELELIKEMKRQEIEEKIRKLKMVTGNDELGFKDEELEDDFDPEAHDRRMQEIFNDEYYQVDEGEEKPEYPSDIEELKVENWDNYDPDSYDPHCEDEDFNMDCDYDPATAKERLQNELIENTKSNRKRRGRRNRFVEMLQTAKPAFNPEDEQTYAEYIDEYYKMDCEDIIGDMPCRFKYVETTPNDFGLTIEEILLAKNSELNQWASLKKAVQIRPDHIEKKDQRLYRMRGKNEDLKKKIFKSLYNDGSDNEEEGISDSNPMETENNKVSQEKNQTLSKKAHKNIVFNETSNNSMEPDAKKAKIEQVTSPSMDLSHISEDQSHVGTDQNKKKSKANKNNSAKGNSKGVTSVPGNPFKSTKTSSHATLPPAKNKIKKSGKTQKTAKLKFNGNPKQKKHTLNKDSKAKHDRLKAYGVNPKKFINKQKFGKT